MVTRVARLSDKREVLFVSPATQHSTLLLYDAAMKSIYVFPASNEQETTDNLSVRYKNTRGTLERP